MTTNENDHEPNSALMKANMAKVEELSQRLVVALTHKRKVDPSLQGPASDLYMKAATAYVSQMMADPSKMIEHQVSYWAQSLQHYVEAQKALVAGKPVEAPATPPLDRRFANPLWQTHPYFNFIKQQYFLNAEAIENAVTNIDGMDENDKKRVEYFTRQITDMFSPTNFLGTNPEALARAVETEGQSLVDGLENLVSDIEANEGDIQVTLADKHAFKIGENIATTPGKVVFRNRLFELIQYTPTTETVHKTPLLIFPPWINKFYIMDLKAQNSLIKWIVDQGVTLFVVSWVNPDVSYSDVGLETYVEEGYLTAIKEVKEITGEDQINAVGYCIAGTTLSMTLSYLHKKKDKSIKSATFFTTMTDFSDQGEFAPFLTDDFVDGIEEECVKSGVLDSFYMSRTFSFLRSNDLIYGPAIRSYMMGQAPPAFDLLFWNGDATNLPGKMVMEYLRGLCQKNAFVGEGYELLGERLHVRDVEIPLFAVTCETDHIAAWRDCYRGFGMTGAKDKTFVVSQSGHIAGVVNPPSKKKYGHYTNEELPEAAADWWEGATFHEGSWWPRWEGWLGKRSGTMIPARELGGNGYEKLCAAPGTYVKLKPEV